MAKITKLSQDNGIENPNGITPGYTKEIAKEFVTLPKINEPYYFGGLTTSWVLKVLSQDENGFTFKTENSTYKVEY